MKEPKALTDYKQQLHRNLKLVAPIFAKASIGDFSQDVLLPEKDDELTVFLVGVQIILNAIREKIDESQSRSIRLDAAISELKHDKAVYHAILSSTAEGLVVVDRDARVTLMNQSAAAMLGIDARQAIGITFYDLVANKDRNDLLVPIENRPLQRAITTGRHQIISKADGMKYVRKDGNLLPVTITASPVKLGNEIIGGVSTFRDVSEEVALDRTKNEIISIASHQLRTPLTAIKWLSEQLITPVSKLSSLKQRRKLRQIHESNERMISLVNDLLNVSRIDLGKLTIMPQEFNLSVLIHDVLRDLTLLIRAQHLRITSHVDQRLNHVKSDPRHLQLILQNLLSNAIKYSRSNQHVIVTAKLQDGKLYLTITDKGIGIPSGQQHKIFEKLFRADNARMAVSEGSGLGLYATKAIIDQLGGKIWFDSVEDKGSTFYVIIPLFN